MLSKFRLIMPVVAFFAVLVSAPLVMAQSYATLGNNPVFSATGGTALGAGNRDVVWVPTGKIHGYYPVLRTRIKPVHQAPCHCSRRSRR